MSDQSNSEFITYILVDKVTFLKNTQKKLKYFIYK